MRGQMAQASAVQLAALGVTAQMIRRRIEAGSWERPWKNLVRLAGSAPSPEQDLLGVCLAHGPGALVCGETAAWLWDMPADHQWADPIHVLCMGNSKVRLSGVETHRSRFVVPADMTVHRGVPVTSWARTIVDNSGRSELSDAQFGWMIDEGIRRKELTYAAPASRRRASRPPRARTQPAANLRLLADRPNDWDPSAVDPIDSRRPMAHRRRLRQAEDPRQGAGRRRPHRGRRELPTLAPRVELRVRRR